MDISSRGKSENAKESSKFNWVVDSKSESGELWEGFAWLAMVMFRWNRAGKKCPVWSEIEVSSLT
jgi:hypothetical protein